MGPRPPPPLRLVAPKALATSATACLLGQAPRLWPSAGCGPVPAVAQCRLRPVCWGRHPCTCTGPFSASSMPGLSLRTSAPGLGSHLPRLHEEWAHSCCAAFLPPTHATLPHLHWDWAHPTVGAAPLPRRRYHTFYSDIDVVWTKTYALEDGELGPRRSVGGTSEGAWLRVRVCMGSRSRGFVFVCQLVRACGCMCVRAWLRACVRACAGCVPLCACLRVPVCMSTPVCVCLSACVPVWCMRARACTSLSRRPASPREHIRAFTSPHAANSRGDDGLATRAGGRVPAQVRITSTSR